MQDRERGPKKRLEKKEIRKSMLSLRNEITDYEKREFDEIILNKLIDEKIFKKSDLILTYLSFGSEVDTYNLINYALKTKKCVAIPKINKNDCLMQFIEINGFENLKRSDFGILEPEGEPADITDNTVIITPGLAFDLNRYRIGYGGGYYDRFNAKYPELIKIGLCYDFQIIYNLPKNDYDIPVDMIITERRIIK